MATGLTSTSLDVHVARMRLACELAWRSNPVADAYCVGCLIVDRRTDAIVATGYSRERAGNTHAEEVALAKVEELGVYARPTVKGGAEAACLDMYATMEPCSVRLSGNATCADRIIADGRIARVYVGVLEPAALVVCKGIAKLRAAGVEVIAVVDAPVAASADGEDAASGRPTQRRRVVRPRSLKACCLAPNLHVLRKQRFRIRRVRGGAVATPLSATTEAHAAAFRELIAMAAGAPSMEGQLRITTSSAADPACVVCVAEAALPTVLDPLMLRDGTSAEGGAFGNATKCYAAERTPVVLVGVGAVRAALPPAKPSRSTFVLGNKANVVRSSQHGATPISTMVSLVHETTPVLAAAVAGVPLARALRDALTSDETQEMLFGALDDALTEEFALYRV
tara:strand:+ start:78 stop:1265 length:1188 start_codon:yes stop_codon:yes gene_type:complete